MGLQWGGVLVPGLQVQAGALGGRCPDRNRTKKNTKQGKERRAMRPAYQ